MSAIIQGDTVIFKNRYGGGSDITLKHQEEEEGYKLVFSSGVVFRQGFNFTEVEFDGMTIKREGDFMVFKRGDKILMKLE
jgi:hypothetical protein